MESEPVVVGFATDDGKEKHRLAGGRKARAEGFDKWKVLPNGWALGSGFSSYTTDDWTVEGEDGGGENGDWRNRLIFTCADTHQNALEVIP